MIGRAMGLTIRQLGIAAAIGVVAISAFALGWWQEDDVRRHASSAATTPPEWRPHKPMVGDPVADAKILAARRPFGAPGERANAPAGGPIGPGGVGAGSAPAVQWRIGGIVATETSRRLVVLSSQPGQNADRAELRQVGESLPDGSVVRSVDSSSVTVDRQGTVVTIRMFAKN
jgi:hypothetical protein